MKLGAIFDMDGLLFDTEVIYNNEWKKIAKVYKLKLQDSMLDELRGTNGDLMNCIVNKYWPSVDAEKLTQELFQNAIKSLSKDVPMKQGVHEILSFLKDRGVLLAIASSTPLILINSNLKKAGLISYFDVVVSGEQVMHGKPAPDIFLLAASKLGLNASDCYVLEDGINGVYAGVCAGCATIMVPDLVKPTAEQFRICIGIYPSLLDVLNEIKNGNC